jgi:hypothetical protein
MTSFSRRAFLASSAAAVASPAAPAWPHYANTMPLDLRIPARHPYLTLTPDQIEHAKQRAQREPGLKQQLDQLLSGADAIVAKPLGKLPPRADVRHRSIGGRLFTVGLAHAFSGDSRYAEWVRDGLVAYADLYPNLQFTRNRHKLFVHSLYEATWVVAVTQAYDLVAGSGVFTAEQSKHVKEDLLRASTACFKVEDFEHDERIRDLHFRCYNFQIWNIAGAGLVGLALKDRELVDWAINSPYGLRHMVGHDINDDGIFWERSEGYHEFVLRGLLPISEALLHCGVDVYNMSVPADRTKDESEHYVTDLSDRPKSLRMMFESLFYLTFPDLSFPALGDASRGPLRANAAFLVGYHRYHDPKLAWLLAHDRPDAREGAERLPQFGSEWHSLVYDPPPLAPSELPIQEGRFANTGELRNGCSLFPSTGVAILRQASGNYTTQPDSTAVSLSYGPHGGGHGHSDNMNIVLYAQGRQWIPAFGSMPYETHWKVEWTAQTVSHNTMVVDEISQKPTGRGTTQWPHDDASDRVVGVLERFEPGSKSVSAHCDAAYEGIRLRRAVRLTGHCVVDSFSATDLKDAPHQFDYVLHIDGEFQESTASLEARSGKLGEICGYQLVEQSRRGTANGPFSLTFASEEKRLRIWIPEAEDTDVIVGAGLTNAPDRKMTMLVLRRKAAAARFITVLEPVNAEDAIRSVRMEKTGVVIDSARGTRRVPLA